MGWLILAVVFVGAGALMWRLGLPRTLGSFAGAALMLGATGYALQGRPDLKGSPVAAASHKVDFDPAASELRMRMFGKFTVADSFFAASDAMSRTGNKRAAIQLLLGGINAAPRNAALWTGLGTAYAEHDGNSVSPAARFAFDRALRLTPEHPGPPYFLGLAYVRAGQFREARRWWVRALGLTPETMSYRAEIAGRLELLDRFLASPEGQGAP